MSEEFLSLFRRYSTEMNTIGSLLVWYGELELALMNCISVARKDLDTILKTMFRTRGETHRIEIADAWGRQIYHQKGLGTQFEMAIGAMRHCLKIRNQYSHCNWHEYGRGNLVFLNLEDLAQLNSPVTDLGDMTFHAIDLPLLQQQQTYFRYTEACLSYLNFEGRHRAGELSVRLVKSPKQLKPPALFNHKMTRSLFGRTGPAVKP